MTDIGPLNPKGTPALPIDDNFIRSLQGYGIENIDPGQGVGLPRLTVLQALSPQVKKGDKQIRGAEPGDFCLIGSDHMDLCKNGVMVAPCFYRTEHVHWAEGQRGDAPVHNYYEDDRILVKCKKVGQNYFLPNGDEVVITATWYPLVTELDDSRPLADAEWVQAFFPLKRSGRTEHKAWKKQIDGEAPIETARGLWKPNVMFWRAWILTPASRHNRKNRTGNRGRRSQARR
jgi:hypothetical protein